MKLRLQALRSLRWNYTAKGVFRWLLGAPPVLCAQCGGKGATATGERQTLRDFDAQECPRCMGEGSNPGLKFGWERIRDEPEKVIQEQTALAEGVT